jgi:D-tyrosyl-tRNA(Tyr) deacylase
MIFFRSSNWFKNLKLVIQRVQQAQVTVEDKIVGAIGSGLLGFLGIHREDTSLQVAPLVEKLVNLRIFHDEAHKMNLSLLDVKGELLIVSQFTLYANCKGRRPSFTDSAPPDQAKELYELFIKEAQAKTKVETGIFGAYMEVSLINDGPITLILEG